MIKLFQYHKFRELFLIEQNVEVKIDLEILSVSINVYNLWVSSFEKVAAQKRLPFFNSKFKIQNCLHLFAKSCTKNF